MVRTGPRNWQNRGDPNWTAIFMFSIAKKITLPLGSQISIASYGSEDDQVVKDVTTIVQRIVNRQGKLYASNKLFGDPEER